MVRRGTFQPSGAGGWLGGGRPSMGVTGHSPALVFFWGGVLGDGGWWVRSQARSGSGGWLGRVSGVLGVTGHSPALAALFFFWSLG